MVLDSCLWTGEVIEPVLLVPEEISILHIILTIDTLFESGQVLDVHKVFGEGFVFLMLFKMQRDRRLVDLWCEQIWELVKCSFLSLKLSLYPGNRVTSKTLSETFNNSSSLENFSSLCSKGLLSQMSIASSISWIVTPNTLYLSGCFHH